MQELSTSMRSPSPYSRCTPSCSRASHPPLSAPLRHREVRFPLQWLKRACPSSIPPKPNPTYFPILCRHLLDIHPLRPPRYFHRHNHVARLLAPELPRIHSRSRRSELAMHFVSLAPERFRMSRQWRASAPRARAQVTPATDSRFPLP
jgi:hypothetical protein